MADTRPPGRLARIPLLAPSGSFGFVPVAALTALAVLVRLGEQGSRIGELLCPELDAKWLAATALAIFLITPKTRGSIPWASLAVHLAVLAVWGLSLRAWLGSPGGSDPTLASVSRSSDDRSDVERVVSLDLGNAAKHLPVRRLSGRNRDITLKISGFLRVVESGVHRFDVRTDGKADLTIDGEPLGPEKAGSTTVSLLPGLHPVEIEYERGSGPAFLRVDWNRPSFFELLPFHGYFSSSPTRLDPPTIRRMETLAVLSLLSSALWWTFCGLLVVRVGEGRAKLYQALSGAGRIDAGVAWVRNHSFLRPCLSVAIGSVLFLAVVLLSLLPRDRDHVFYRETSSEFMMQTVSVADLKQQPFRSLWFLHIQPPLLDAIRMVAAQLSSASEDEELVREVDGVIRLLWVLGHAALATLICLWLCRTTSPKFAVTASILFAAHPAGVFYATLLDSTLLSSLWFTWCCYELWRFYEGRGSVARLVVATLALFFTRSIFQWPFLLLMAGALLLLRARRREVTIFAAVVGVAASLYVGKQFALFGMTYTSSFAGYNGLRSISGDLTWDIKDMRRRIPQLPPPSAARVLSREAKVNGEYNFNQLHYLRISFGLMDRYKRTLLRNPALATLNAYRENLRLYLEPSSRYSANAVVDGLPWRSLYDRLFSGTLWVFFAVSALGVWVFVTRGRRLGPGVGLALPVAYVILASILFESGENMRFRFFVEPVIYVFVLSQLHRSIGRLKGGHLVPEDRK